MTNFAHVQLDNFLKTRMRLSAQCRHVPPQLQTEYLAEKYGVTVAEVIERAEYLKANTPKVNT